MTKLRWFLLISICFNDLGYCRNSQYYDTNLYTDCFQGAKGWYNIAATCVFPLTQFERNYTTAVQMCGAVNHSIGYRETNWLIAPQLAQLLTNEQNPTYRKMYWTGLVIKDEQTIGVKTGNITDTNLDSISDFTSIFNPLWAIGQPPEDISMDILSNFCIALDFRNSSSYGWRALPCSYQLPILCQNYACLPDTFRCFDNSKCIPGSMKNDGYNDCLDGSDESELTKIPISSSTQNTLLSNILRENPMYVWPMIMSTGGVLSPKTVKYGRGECTHKWTVISPNDKYFMIGLKWTNPTTWTNILIEGKDGNGRIMLNSRNSTTSFSMFSSSFVLTASNTDTRRTDFQMFFQEIDDSLCKISEDNQLLFDSETIPMPCNYHFSTKSPSSYVALLIRKCEGLIPFVSSIQFNNSTVFLAPSSLKKILIIPSNSLDIHVNSTWPGTDTKLDIQFFELAPGEESVDMFLIDSNLEIEWISRSNDICMEGKFRTLTVNMIMTSSVESLKSSIWRTEKFRKSCSEDNVQIISRNLSTFVTDSGVISGFGPTTVIIHQSAEPFEFKSIYSIQQSFPETAGSFLNVIYEELEEATQVSVDYSTTTAPRNSTPCKLPSVTSGYILNVTSTLYLNGTKVYINCEQGFILHPLPYVITCREDGIWTDNTGEQTYGKENPQVECRPITCPGETQVETQTHLVPNNFNINYGAVRHYSNMTNGFGFGPFCICGDYEPTSWQCYNDNWNGTDETFPNACIMPEFNDSVLVSGPYRSVFPDNFVISMKCMLCPSLIKNYTCQNGLWMNSEGHIQPYGTFKCDCSEAGDPCKPHGTYIQHVGFTVATATKDTNSVMEHASVHIDECQEQSDYCDRGIYSSCNNTIGGFNCPCSPNYHTYYKDSTDYSQWGSIERSLIEGYSCIETTCAYSDNWNKDKLNVTGPPLSYWYQSGTPVGDFYAQDVCGDRCVIRFKVSCQDTTLYSVPDGLRTCPEIDTDIFDIQTGNQLTKVFGTAVLSCKRGQLLIGRPKVFCNSTAQWEIMPICIYQSCSNLKQFVHWPLYIANISSPNSGFEYETTVYFGCDLYGYTLYGPGSITCVLVDGNYDWSEPLPTCIQTTSTVFTTPSTSEISTGTRTYFAEASTPSTSQFPWATTRTSPITGGSTKPTQLPIFQDDVVIEGSMILEETNILHRKELWTQTADWIWTSSNCIIHQWTFPISFLVTSTPFELNSDEIELLIDISQCNSSVQVAISTSIDGFIPPISDFRPILNTTSSGSFVVKLRNLKSFLALSITANGFVQICGVIIRENMCDEVDFNGLHFASSKPFSMRRYLLATCGNRIAPINGYCDSQKGWVVQNKPCLCNTKPSCVTSPLIPQRDQFALCDLNSCRNGECQQLNGTFSCICNEYLYGRSCDVYKNCFDVNDKYICLNGGTCILDGINTRCNCTSHFNGAHCEIALDDENCLDGENKCENGSCRRENDEVYCNCNNGFIRNVTGLCTVEWDMCQLNKPCQQNGLCNFNVDTGKLNCDCTETPGWHGQYCEKEPKYDDCTVCVNSDKCYDEFTSNVRCQCSVGFSGDHCTDPIDDCPFEPCLNGGTCNPWQFTNPLDNVESYNCTCPSGYSGTNCEIRICEKECQNGGTCYFSTPDTTNCSCLDQFYGTYCEKNCESYCLKSIGCSVNKNGTINCECENGFSDDRCDRVNVCEAHILVCQNSGTCNTETQKCDCPDLFNGTYCEQNLNKCETNSIFCENGGSCIKETGKCECPDNYTGDLCENQIIKCDNITCYNGGTCRNGSCVCLPGTTGDFCEDFGQPCMIVNPNGTISPYCLNGICYNLPTGASCDCDGTEFTGRRCETKSFVNFNLVFNGLDYVPDIVTHQFYNSSVAQFTLCSFVQYNHPTADSNQENSQNVTLPPFLTFRGLENNSQQIVFDNNGFFICDGDKKCNRDNYPFTPTPITANTWHHFCLVSPLNLTSPTYFVYLDGIRQPDQRATAFNSILTVYLQLAPSYLSEKRFEGMISMTELYSVRLSDSEIGQLAFNCNATLNTSGNKPFITWNDFTRVSSSNPGVYIDPAGICNSVKCMFGRQIGKTNCDVDRISPTVLKCPSRQQRSTTNDFIKVNWPDEEISFFDNIGVTRIEANYQNGQQFGIGITAIRYVAFDAAENSAECTFDVVVVQRGCPTENQTYVEGGTRQFISSNAPFASKVAKVQCNDVLYPVENRPRFYVCDIMGYYNYGGWIEGNTKKYYLPSCGKTFPALQKLNGTVVGSGSCQQVAQKLRDVINATVNCNQIKCNITTTQCNQTTNIFWNSRENENSSYPIQYWFSTSNSTETVSSVILQNLQSSFSVVRQDSNIECNPSFPIQNRNGNVTVCVSCPMGTYANTKLNKCMDCPFNTYRNSTDQNQLSCVQCPENTITGDVIGAVDISQCYRNCDEGEYESRGNCLPCPIGTYSPTRGLRKCICCEFDSSTDDTGKRSIEDCSVFCGSGQEMIRNGTSSPYCQDCSFGFYKVEPDLKNFNAIKIVLPVVFGVLLIIVVVVLFCFRKQIMAWFRKTDTSGDQHVPVSHWPEPPTIPRPGLRIVTSREEMDQLPPLRRSTSSLQMDLRSSNFPSANQNSSRRLGSPLSTELTFISSDGRYFEANGSPKIQRGTTPIRSESVSDDSMLDSFF
uniref:C-type lectin domain-containing protein n=1 Tax=Caenorhabditis tropicalis TaxID=1561998 RepID=A0A1I7UYA9_9PELO